MPPQTQLTVHAYQCPSMGFASGVKSGGAFGSYVAAIAIKYLGYVVEVFQNKVAVIDPSGVRTLIDTSNADEHDRVQIHGGHNSGGLTVVMSTYSQWTVLVGMNSFVKTFSFAESNSLSYHALNAYVHLAEHEATAGTGLCKGPCTTGTSASGSCDNSACLAVCESDVIFSESTFSELSSMCGAKPEELNECAPAKTSEEICSAMGNSFEDAAALCEATYCDVASHLVAYCQYDICTGASDGVINMYKDEATMLCDGWDDFADDVDANGETPDPITPMPPFPPPAPEAPTEGGVGCGGGDAGTGSEGSGSPPPGGGADSSAGKIIVHGDPMLKHNGKPLHFSVPAGELSHLLRWTSKTGSRMELRGRVVERLQGSQQWFKTLAITSDGKPIVVVTAVESSKGEMTLSVDDGASHVFTSQDRRVSKFARWVTVSGADDAFGQTIRINADPLKFEIFARPAGKFESVAEQVHGIMKQRHANDSAMPARLCTTPTRPIATTLTVGALRPRSSSTRT